LQPPAAVRPALAWASHQSKRVGVSSAGLAGAHEQTFLSPERSRPSPRIGRPQRAHRRHPIRRQAIARSRRPARSICCIASASSRNRLGDQAGTTVQSDQIRQCAVVRPQGARCPHPRPVLPFPFVPTLEETTYEAGRSALADQESLVAGSRQRTGTLLAAHALVASFLGAITVRARGLSAQVGSTLTRAISRDPSHPRRAGSSVWGSRRGRRPPS
jgi:hypothetical protein